MKAYLDIVQKILDTGVKKMSRPGIETYAIAGEMFSHDMSEGFPLLTTKKVPFRLVASELEFFIKGITDKQWLIERNNHIWDEWANPQKAPYGHDEESKRRMMDERDLGPIYGFQWRHFGAEYENYDTDYTGKGVDQLAWLVDRMKTNPNCRRMIVSSWNPTVMHQMGLPPCHYQWQVTITDGKVNLLWSQRSIDTMLGLPFNIASYALLLHLLAKETELEEGRLVGFLGDVHIYDNHVDGAREQLSRDPNKYSLPTLTTENFSSIFDWEYKDSKLEGYESYGKIPFEIAV